MARMYPPEVGKNTKSKAERLYFGVIQRELPDTDWIVLHSLGLAAIHLSKPWSEIDFVVIGPPGLFCLEMKGGRVTFEDGKWHFTDKNECVTVKNEGPFEQVSSASTSLYKYLAGKLPTIRNTTVGYGVVCPDIVWSIERPDCVPELVYDECDKQRPFSTYISRIAAYWEKWMLEHLGRTPQVFDSRDRQRVLEKLRGDFDLRPSMRSRIDLALDDLIALTKQQYRVLDELRDNARIMIQGGAGTGKTLLVIEEARRRAIDGEKVFLCCYNRNLASFLRAVMVDIENIDVYHLHGFMAEIIAAANLLGRLPEVREEDLFAIFYPELCQEGLITLDRWQTYDVLIIDEAQDLLRDTYVQVLDALVKGGLGDGNWKIFMDPNQDIFSGIDPGALNRFSNARPAQCRLSLNCRNTSPIGIITRLLSGINCDETLETTGPEVEQHWYQDSNDQRRKISKCINRLLGEHIPASEIIVLSRYRRKNSSLREGLIDVPFSLVDMDPTNLVTSQNNIIRFSTIGAFKGLESKAVILADVDDLISKDARVRTYESCSRAIAYLALFINEDLKSDYSRLAHEYGKWLGATSSD